MKIYHQLKYSLIELKELGFKGGFYRIFYEIGWRSGLFIIPEYFYGKLAQHYTPNMSWDDWKQTKKEFFVDGIIPKIQKFLQNLPTNSKNNIIQIADNSLQGEIYCFSSWFGRYGNPIDWNLNPVKNIKWPLNVHWSKALKFSDGGDIKLVWEVNRFPQVYYLVRAYYISGDKKYISCYMDQIREWSENNPFLKGPNWASGQEVAIRLLTWIFGLYSFCKENVMEEDDFKILLKQIYLHTWCIYKHINFSNYAVRNNHLIGEALALYMVGTIFPFLKGAERWRKKGRRILERKTPTQFYPDGGYCQLSHNYHRLALHYYLWAIRIAELNDDPVADIYKDVIKKSVNFIYQNMNLSDGKLPNWGNNDGALLNPWTSCDYTDFRPVVQSAAIITGTPSPLPAGPWDEELMWLCGRSNIRRDMFRQASYSYTDTGVHILRQSENDYCVMRAGTPPDRFGQADQLHLDIFIDGKNLAVDGGSYLYNDELSFHYFFMGSGSHNTITVDNKDQMLLWRRFKWLFNTKARLRLFDDKNMIMTGEHEGYRSDVADIIHCRNLKMESEKIIVEDILFGKNCRMHKFNLHWQLDIEKIHHITSDELHVFHLHSGDKLYYMYMWSKTDTALQLLNVDVNNGLVTDSGIDGWYSRYYGLKQNIFAIQGKLNSDKSPEFYTVFSKKQLTNNEVLACVSY